MKLFNLIILTLWLVWANCCFVHSGDVKFHFGDTTANVPTLPVSFPNIDQVGRGYDYLYGNPHSTTGPDPGLRMNIFRFVANTTLNALATISGDGRFVIPNGMTAYQEVSCELDFTSSVVTTMSSYAASISAEVSGSISDLVGSFSMSSDFQYAHSSLSSGSSQFTKATSNCILYTINLHEASLPPFDSLFTQEVERTALNTSLIGNFINQFGTHYIVSAKMGSRFGQQSQITTKYAQSSSSTSLSVSASYSGMMVSGSAMASAAYDQANSFASNCSSQSIYSVGALPAANGDATTWAAQSIVNPAIVSITDANILSTLFTTSNFPNVSATNLKLLSSAFTSYLNNYCQSTVGATCTTANQPINDKCFGGWYTTNQSPSSYSGMPNPLTGTYACPTGYYAVGIPFNANSPSQPDVYDMGYCQSYNAADCNTGSSTSAGATSFGGFYIEDNNNNCFSGNCKCATSDNLIAIKVVNDGYFTIYMCIIQQVALLPSNPAGDGYAIGGAYQIGSSKILNEWIGSISSQSCTPMYAPYLFYSSSQVKSYLCLRIDNPLFTQFALPDPSL